MTALYDWRGHVIKVLFIFSTACTWKSSWKTLHSSINCYFYGEMYKAFFKKLRIRYLGVWATHVDRKCDLFHFKLIDSTKFVFLSLFLIIETICRKIWAKIPLKNGKKSTSGWRAWLFGFCLINHFPRPVNNAQVYNPDKMCISCVCFLTPNVLRAW